MIFFFFSSRRRHTRLQGDWSSDVCSSDLLRWLSDRQRPDGSWAFSAPVPEASWATGIATLAMLGQDRDRASSSAGWLLGQQGRSLGWHLSLLYRVAPSLLPVRLNPDLKGWPWR